MSRRWMLVDCGRPRQPSIIKSQNYQSSLASLLCECIVKNVSRLKISDFIISARLPSPDPNMQLLVFDPDVEVEAAIKRHELV